MTGPFGQYRTSKSLQYTTPDMNGFKAAILIKADSSSDGQGAVSKPTDNLVLSVRDVVTISTNVTVTREVINVSTSKVKVDDESGHSYEPYYVNSRDWGTSNVGGTVRTTVRVSTIESEPVQGNKDDNDIDHWSIAAKYDIAGFSTGLSFSRYADAIGRGRFNATTGKRESDGRVDRDSWAFKLGYSQDDWYVNGWYGQISDADGRVCGTRTVTTPVEGSSPMMTKVAVKCGDTEVFSMAGGISVDKVKVYAVYDTRERDAEIDGNLKRADDTRSTLGVQYTLGSNSWTWVEYAGRDFDTSKTENSDFSIGLGHSF
jgi:predicted porin